MCGDSDAFTSFRKNLAQIKKMSFGRTKYVHRGSMHYQHDNLWKTTIITIRNNTVHTSRCRVILKTFMYPICCPRVAFKLVYRPECLVNVDDSMTINTTSIGKRTLMFSFYFILFSLISMY